MTIPPNIQFSAFIDGRPVLASINDIRDVVGIDLARTNFEQGADRIRSVLEAVLANAALVTAETRIDVGNNAASISSAIALSASADQALAGMIESLSAATDSNLATINQALVTQTTTNSSFAGMIDTLTSTTGGHTSTLTIYGQTLDGLSARWGVEFNAQGVVSGFALNNGAGRTDATFLVNTFKIAQPGAAAGVSVFNIRSDGVVEMPSVEVQKLKIGSVDVNALAFGAAQKAAFYTTPGDIAIPRNATATIADLVFVKEDTDSILEVQMFCDVRSGDDLQFDYSILIDGNPVKDGRTNIILDSGASNGQMPITPFMFLPGVSAAQHTISFRVTNRETDNVTLTVLAGATLKVNELRKASIGTSSGSGGAIVPSTSGGGSGGTGGTGGTGGGGGGGYVGRVQQP